MLKQYYILTGDPHYTHVVRFIKSCALPCEIHLNRVRFWIDTESYHYTEFALRYGHLCPLVIEVDYANSTVS